MSTLPRWIIVWFVFSIIFTGWDALFILMRPDSFATGHLAYLFKPYVTYVTIDWSYLDIHNPFLQSLALMDFFEIGIALFALYFNARKQGALAILFAFSSLLLTGSKTLLVFGLEAFNHFQHVAHNSLSVLLFQYILPNGLWVVFPFLGVFVLGRMLVKLTRPLSIIGNRPII